MVNRKVFLFFSILSSLVLLSCYTEPTFIKFDAESFNREWAAWEAQGLGNYSVDEDFHLPAGFGNVRIVVQNNVIIQKEALDEWTSPEHVSDALKTISEVYAWVNREYERALEQIEEGELRGMTIKLTYNKEFHYPEYVSLAWEGWAKGDTGVPPTYIYLSVFRPIAIPAE